jgi:ATP-grasp domain-containing protein
MARKCSGHQWQVHTCSPYWRDGELALAQDGTWPAPIDERDAALAFAHTLLADVQVAMPPAFVLDVGVISGRGWAVVEANSAWGAGIYGCEAAQVLQVLRRLEALSLAKDSTRHSRSGHRLVHFTRSDKLGCGLASPVGIHCSGIQ